MVLFIPVSMNRTGFFLLLLFLTAVIPFSESTEINLLPVILHQASTSLANLHRLLFDAIAQLLIDPSPFSI